MQVTSQHPKTAFLQQLKNKRVLLLDGGLSNQLEDQGVDLNHALWSALLLKDNPAAIVTAHRHYLEAGANCIITASYQASKSGFMRMGLSQEQALLLIKESVSLAHAAVDAFLQDKPDNTIRPLVAASIGPYGACQADGSEYHGNYGINDEALREFHSERLKLLDQTPADILACETIPSRQEAVVLHKLLASVDTPAWLSFSCQSGELMNDGSLIGDVARQFAEHPKVVALGVNCTGPQYINELIRHIKVAAPNKAIVVYPNSGEQYNTENKTWHGTSTPEDCGMAASSWIKSGASIIGGCCRMGPEHIKAMNAIINQSA